MTYPHDIGNKLGFDQIKHRIENYCLGTLGKVCVTDISFVSDFSQIQTLLQQSREFKNILERGEVFPLSNYFDPTDLYGIISIEGSFIEAESLHDIAFSLETIFSCIQFVSKSKEELPSLHALADEVTLDAGIVSVINAKINDVGVIKDNASTDLSRIRKKLKDLERQARRLIDQLFREASSNGFVPEGMLPVVRDGRVVIPVLPEYKRKLKGVVMGESATGQTVYMEPSEVIEANNDIRELELEERKACIKILRDLTNHLRLNLDALMSAFKFLGQIDFIEAKAKFAVELDAGMPKLVDYPHIDWKEARHPLLYLSCKGKSPVVPLTADLRKDDHFLLVSGPNAGGKSVCLKTVGLIQYMLQCGLLVPINDNSIAGVFDQLFIDIGDQQSIENDLSTYSSHLRNMCHFIKKATSKSLVLIDELGAGTDPNFGGGIAEAILKELLLKKVWGVATTHYYNLKLFADKQSGIRNASMQFDSKKLEPLFTLEIGKPGSSFALEIAEKTGLSKLIIENAEEVIGKDLTSLETLMKKVADEKQSLSQREALVTANERKYNDLVKQYSQLSEQLESQKKEIINRAKAEASLMLKQTNKEIEKTIRHIKENRAEKKETRKIRQTLQAMESRVRPAHQLEAIENEPIDIGNSVRIVGQEAIGTLISVSEKTATVQFGQIRLSILLSKLVKAGRVEKRGAKLKVMGVDFISRQSRFNSTLDVRGKRVEEVISLIDQFIDDAVLLGHGALKILHGKGEGVLRKVVRNQLKRSKAVVSFADEHVERGGAGVTQLVLR